MGNTSRLVLGTAQLGMDYGIANTQGAPDYNHAFDIINTAINNGIHTFDTAQAYGKSEKLLGRILSKLNPTSPLKIITKIDPAIDHLNPNEMEQGLLKSLEHLKQKNLYGYMLHGEQFLSLWDKGLKDILLSFKHKGLVKKIGISVDSPTIALKCLNKDNIDLIQVPSNIFDHRFEKNGVFKQAKKKDKIVFVRSVLLQGLLVMEPKDLSPHMNYAIPALEHFEKQALKTNLSKKQLAIGYVKQTCDQAMVIFGVETVEQLKENLSLWNHSFSDDLKVSIDKEPFKIDKRIIRPYTWGQLNVMAILQARMSSSRLPGKVLKNILGKPLLELQIERLLRSNRIERLVVATSINKEDDPIESLCKKLGITCFRGSLDNVLDRFYQSAKKNNAQNIVRLTADCPLCDHEKIDDLINFFMEQSIDYASNCTPPKLPDGLDAEIFTFQALKKMWENAKLSSEKEHVTLYIENNPSHFKTDHLTYEQDYSSMRWTVDEPEDFMFVKKIYETLYPDNPFFNTKDIMAFLKANPDIGKINDTFKRNEGFQSCLDNHPKPAI